VNKNLPNAPELQQLRRAALALAANPFTARRAELDLELTSGRRGDAAFGAALLEIEALASRCLTLEGRERLSSADRESAFRAYLFALFHRSIPAMTQLIAAEATSEAPVPAPFAQAIVAELESKSVPRERAERLVALLYQTQRAFVFLSRELRGPSSSMQRLRASLWNAVFTHDVARYEASLWDRMEDFSALLLGETGTGKGAAAAAIGRSGIARFDRRRSVFLPGPGERFLAANLAEVPETLIESALFGHEKGAFTGATAATEGFFARTPKHGALFLDELGDVPLHVQVKLLRVLQERSFTPVGGKKARHFSGRVIAATHRPIDQLRREGLFRDDLYYRLSTEAIVVPPLRLRIEESEAELPALVAHVVERTLGAADEGLTAEVLGALRRDVGAGYAWPGNVRELEQCVRQVLLTGRSVRSGEPGSSPVASMVHAIEVGDASADEVLARYCALLHQRHGSYEAVAAIARLDRRTVKKHVLAAATLK
jgi:sigma-54 specific flagellar transcriptional regulator A